ncbi:hypothetical protein LMG26696_03023 [Achromobacter pulmonis]|nr:hypothetical protein LMG26696_03023 [Achromobacter pulmonis]
MLCQLKCATSKPPSIGPTISEMALHEAHRPMARARSAGSGKACVSNDMAPGISSAPATPCTARPASSSGRLSASPQKADPSVNSATPASHERLRP